MIAFLLFSWWVAFFTSLLGLGLLAYAQIVDREGWDSNAMYVLVWTLFGIITSGSILYFFYF